LQLIEVALWVLGGKSLAGPYPRAAKNFEHVVSRRLQDILSQHTRGLWISQQISENRREEIGLTAYFPYPKFIIEEQITKLKDGDKTGKTENSDSRYIKPILSTTQIPTEPPSLLDRVLGRQKSDTPKFLAQELLDELDKDREANEKAFLNKGNRQWLLDREIFAHSKTYLHKHLGRLNCYGFRGDKRPAAVIQPTGFLPGVTRSDAGVDNYKHLAELIESAKWQGAESYQKVMKDLDIFTLAVYTADANFRGYISTSTSTAIAKHFANAYASKDKPFEPVYCYAMRCDNAFHLPTEVKGAWHKWSKKTDAKNAFVHNAEQEVAVLGGIGWYKVAGMRVIRIDESGQFFCGPVFMRDMLRQDYQDQLPKTFWQDKKELNMAFPATDDAAFDELFELFSGKSQGADPGIFFSYKEAPFPFDCPESLIGERNKLEEVELHKISKRR
jgi:hypothetical protein